MPRVVQGLVLAGLLGFVVLYLYLTTPIQPHAPSHGKVRLFSEIQQRKLFGARVRRMLASRQYDRLESLADSLLEHDVRTPSGMPKIATFFVRGFSEVDDPGSPEQWADHLQNLRSWAEERPQSAIAAIALAQGLLGRGSTARGASLAVAVSPTHAEQFVQDADEADQILNQSSPGVRLRSEWYEAELSALDDLGWAADSAFRATAVQAMTESPADFRLYETMAVHLMPRWYGKAGDWEAFMDTCASSLPDSDRDEIYARVVEDQNHYVPNVFSASPSLSWGRTENGLERWARHCPASLQPRSAMAMLAWEGGHRSDARQAFEALDDSVEVDVWNDYSLFWLAKEWAYSNKNVVAARTNP
jgi:hypothetical protein